MSNLKYLKTFQEFVNEQQNFEQLRQFEKQLTSILDQKTESDLSQYNEIYEINYVNNISAFSIELEGINSEGLENTVEVTVKIYDKIKAFEEIFYHPDEDLSDEELDRGAKGLDNKSRDEDEQNKKDETLDIKFDEMVDSLFGNDANPEYQQNFIEWIQREGEVASVY